MPNVTDATTLDLKAISTPNLALLANEKPYVRKGKPRLELAPEATSAGLENRKKLLQLASLLMKILGFIRNKGGETGANFLEKLMKDPKIVKKTKDPAEPKPSLDEDTNTFNETVLRHLHEHPKLLKRVLLDMRVAAADVAVKGELTADAPVAALASAIVKPVICGQYTSRVAASSGKGYGISGLMSNRPDADAAEAIGQSNKKRVKTVK